MRCRPTGAAPALPILITGLLALGSLPGFPRQESGTSERDPLALADQLLGQVPPTSLERTLESDPALGIRTLSALGEALASADPAMRDRLAHYLVEAARARCRRLAGKGPPWADEEVLALLTLQLVDPERFAEDPAFRALILRILPEALDPVTPAEIRERLLRELNSVRGFDFAASDLTEAAWGAAPRRSLPREVPYAGNSGRIVDDLSGSIEASIYCLPSRYFDEQAVRRFLFELRRVAPRRTLIAMTDQPLRSAVQEWVAELDVHLIETYGRDYSPWPRDPFSLRLRPDGGVLVLIRPNLQLLREADNEMGLELIQGLPDTLDEAWGRPGWERAPVPFHNGQVLLTRDRAWISIHTLELGILQLLGESEVPVESFRTREGWNRYADAARAVAARIGALYGRQAHFVHPLPLSAEDPPDEESLLALGGGAGFDLDSVLTILRGPGDGYQALVGDIQAGRAMLEGLAAAEVDRFRDGFQLGPEREALRRGLLEAQRSPRAVRLGRFLELLAEHLGGEGLRVQRLPVLLVPTRLLLQPPDARGDDFLITWNNVVLETGERGPRAEGFLSSLPTGDALARSAFAKAGYRLDLLPTLTASVILNGGYRCASQHLRR